MTSTNVSAESGNCSERRILCLVPGIPHVEHVTDTSPPWTVPATPTYALDPHLEVMPVNNAAPSSASQSCWPVSPGAAPNAVA